MIDKDVLNAARSLAHISVMMEQVGMGEKPPVMR